MVCYFAVFLYFCITMQEELTITSLQNPRIKALLQLQQKSAVRRKEGLFVVEGQRELMHCLEKGWGVESVFLNPDLPTTSEGDDVLDMQHPGLRGCTVYRVSAAVYGRIAYRGSTEGVVATVRTPSLSLADLKGVSKAPLYVILEGVEKPGNMGAVLRSADAAGVDAVIACDALTDIFNPNLIRASLGGIFSVPVATATSQECIAFLKEWGVRILTAQLQDSQLYYDTDMTGPTAIVMGTESTGLTQQWRDAADAHIRIPMLGILDSLNVSVSAAILMFEAVRQRQNA